MRRPASLALRVTAFVGAATTLVFVAFGLLLVRSLQHHFAQQDAAELAVVAASVQKVLDDQPTQTSVQELSRRLAGAVAGHHGVFYYVADHDGRALYASPGPALDGVARSAPASPQVQTTALHILEERGTSYRVAVLRHAVPDAAGPRAYTMAVATNMDAHLRYLQGFEQSLWLTTVIVSVIALLAARLAVLQGHAPIRRISSQINAITSAHLHVRLEPAAVPIELAALAESFNEMLMRLEEGFGRLSHFSDDIAHELRTPVTNLITETQVALNRSRSTDEYREILYSNLEEFERMSKMISDMLFLAKAENDLSKLDIGDVDLVDEIHRLFQYYDAWADDKGVVLKLEGQCAPVRGDALMLRRALGNLLSNAIRHSPGGGTVRVQLAPSEQRSIVSISNTGSEIAPEHLPRLFDRFYRVDPSRRRSDEGAGLGLAIAKSIVGLHHGKIAVTSKDAVTTFRVELPKRQADGASTR